MERSGFFNSVNGDRKYKADFFAEYFSSFIGNGIFSNPSTNCQVLANNDMSITIKQGKAWINGYYYSNTNDFILTLDNADGVLRRIDRIVLQYNTIDRTITARIKKGIYSTEPVATDLQRDEDAFELGLADIYIGQGVLSITQAQITDLRFDSNNCGIVHGLLEQVDTTTLLNQYTDGFALKQQEFEQGFYSWLATIQNALEGETAGNLLSLINTNTAYINTLNGIGEIEEKANKDYVGSQFSVISKYSLANVTGTSLSIGIPNGKVLSDREYIWVELDQAISGGDITITYNGANQYHLKDTEGNLVVSLDKGLRQIQYREGLPNYYILVPQGKKIEDIIVELEDRGVGHTHFETDATSYKLSGNKKTDSLCWNNICIYENTPTSGTLQLASCLINHLRFGDYTLSVRLKSSNNALATEAIKIEVLKNEEGTYTSIASRNIKANEFINTLDYSCFNLRFNYGQTKAQDNELKILVTLLSQTTSYEVKLDSIVISPVVVGVFSV